MTYDHIRWVLRIRAIEPGDIIRVEWDLREMDDDGREGVFPQDPTVGYLVEVDDDEDELVIIREGQPFNLQIPLEWINAIVPAGVKLHSVTGEHALYNSADVLQAWSVSSHEEAVEVLAMSSDAEIGMFFDHDAVVFVRGDWEDPDEMVVVSYPVTVTELANVITTIEQKEVTTPE